MIVAVPARRLLQAQLYSDYFENLDPTLDAAAAGIQASARALRGKRSGDRLRSRRQLEILPA